MKKIFLLLAIITSISSKAQVIIDTSFGVSGITEMPFDSSGNDISKSILLSNGKIIFVSTKINGANSNEPFITRINSNGTIDTSFGVNGFVSPNIQGDYEISTKIQSDNSILIYGGYNPAKLIKYTENGILDNTFGVNGVVDLGLNTYPSESDISFSNNNLLLQNDGNIIIRYIQNSNVFLKKVLSGGTPDNTFGINSLIQNIISKEIFISSDNKIIGFNFASNNYTIEKFNLNGTNDTTFGTNGNMVVSLPYTNFENKYIEQDNLGRFLVEKLNFNTTPAFQFDAFRLNNNGLLDTSFGVNGYVNFNNFQTLIIPTILVNNKYYLGGTTIVSNALDNLIMLKYNEDGTLDTSFNGNGYKIENINTIQEACESINVQTDGKILVSGEYKNGSTKKLYLMRYVDQNLSTNNFENTSLKIVNPIKETLNLITENEINNVTIIGIDGKVILKTNEKIINTSKLSKGVYVVVVEFKNENKKHIAKIIKE
jgi:uncharacterized delta-60 repeat protein